MFDRRELLTGIFFYNAGTKSEIFLKIYAFVFLSYRIRDTKCSIGSSIFKMNSCRVSLRVISFGTLMCIAHTVKLHLRIMNVDGFNRIFSYQSVERRRTYCI